MHRESSHTISVLPKQFVPTFYLVQEPVRNLKQIIKYGTHDFGANMAMRAIYFNFML